MAQEQKKWLDIKHQIQSDILNKKLVPGDKLPRDSDMALDYGVARNTIQRAMRELAELGVVERRRKGGTYIAPFANTQTTIQIKLVQDEIESLGGRYGYHFVSQGTKNIPDWIQKKWQTEPSTNALHIECIHTSDNTPYMYEDRWVNTAVTPDIVGIDFRGQSVNEWLIKNRPYSHVSMDIYAIDAPLEIAQSLDIQMGQSILVIDRTTWLHGTPITTVCLFTKPGYKIINS